MSCSDERDRLNDVRRPGRAGDAEVGHDAAGERERAAREPGHGAAASTPANACSARRTRPRGELHREREQRERAEGREQRAGDEDEPCARVAPAQRQPGDARALAYATAAPCATLPSGKIGHEEREREPEPRRPQRRGAGRERQRGDEPGRPERQQRGARARR